MGLTRSLCERHLVIRAVEKPPQNDADARSVTPRTRSIVTYPKIPLETPSFSRAHDPSWSPDGTKIIFNLFTATSPGTGQEGIYTANADGTNIQQITSNPEFRDNYPDWGPHPLAT